MSEWQPIETAPKDGNKFLAFNSKRKIYYVAWWGKQVNKMVWKSRVGLVSPTHWMPLPEGPK